MSPKHFKGFTLIELSIVLVVIGLVVGGILVGQSLITQAGIRSVIKDVEKFNTAVNTFKSKYNCLPGDCINATTFFGINSSGCPNQGGATGTCNGDGNGVINAFNVSGIQTAGPGTSAYGGSVTYLEEFLFWQHLSLAGLVAGSFTGEPGNPGSARQVVIGSNVPASLFRNGGYTLTGLISAGQPDRWTSNSQHNFEFGVQPAPGGWTGGEGDGFILTAKEMQAMDCKFDDCMPGTGTIQTVYDIATGYAAVNTCVTSNSPFTATYNPASSGLQCSVHFNGSF